MIRNILALCLLVSGLALSFGFLPVSGAAEDEEPRKVAWRLFRRSRSSKPTVRVGNPPRPAPTAAAAADAMTRREANARRVSPVSDAKLRSVRSKIQRCLDVYYKKPVSTADRSCWGIMHALIAFGVDTEIYARGRRVNAIGWLCWNGSCRGYRLMYLEQGEIQVREGPGLQGHAGQFLAMLAQSRVRNDYSLKVDGHEFTIEDLVKSEQRGCQAGTELTFKLIALSHYLPSDVEWQNQAGENWDIPRLIREELRQPIMGAACGGTHRLMGLSYAVRKRMQRKEPIEGEWLRAREFQEAYQAYTFRMQNEDGSFSTNWFRGPGSERDNARRLQTTGHILEWLAFSLSDEQLREPRVVKAVDYLATLMLKNHDVDWEIGPRGHALRALVLYQHRVFAGSPSGRPRLARRGAKSNAP